MAQRQGVDPRGGEPLPMLETRGTSPSRNYNADMKTPLTTVRTCWPRPATVKTESALSLRTREAVLCTTQSNMSSWTAPLLPPSATNSSETCPYQISLAQSLAAYASDVSYGLPSYFYAPFPLDRTPPRLP